MRVDDEASTVPTPVAEEVCGVHSRANQAPHIVPFVQRAPHHLPAER
jgi:hypothetical protein